MKEIPLTKGYVAIVDDEDYEYLMQWKWYAHKSNGGIYAQRGERKYERKNPNKRMDIYMHNVIAERMKLKWGPGEKIDHQNFNTLDNKRCGLRVLTNSESILHRQAQSGTSKFLGVSWHKQRSKWQARYSPVFSRFPKYIGLFTDEILAAQRALEARFIAGQLVPIWALERWEQACREESKIRSMT